MNRRVMGALQTYESPGLGMIMCASGGRFVLLKEAQAVFEAAIAESNDRHTEMLAALLHAENALADYIPTMEQHGSTLNYGHSVLRAVRAAIENTQAMRAKDKETPK